MTQTYKHFVPLFLCMMGFALLHVRAAEDRDNNELKGSGTAEYPYLIEDAFDLMLMQQKIDKSMEASKGKYYKLAADIRLNEHVLNDDGTLAADTARLTKWTPIGKGESSTWSLSSPYYTFQGNFDGDGHTIYGIYINDSTGHYSKGLFGAIDKGGTVRRLRIADSYIVGTEAVGAIAGQCCNGLIEDCESKATVIGVGTRFYAGGIAGIVSTYDGRLRRCTNSGNIIGHSSDLYYSDGDGNLHFEYPGEGHTGGICGIVSGATVDSCLNSGSVVTEYRGEAGGIAGQGGGYVRNSINKGTVTALVQESIGGIVGTIIQSVGYCRNEGQLVATVKGSSVGGIAGRSSFSPSVYNSVNLAEIVCDVDSVFVGGIIGNMDGGYDYYNGYKTPKVYNSVNYGHLMTTQPKSRVGGISGRTYCGEIYDSENHGDIMSESLAGGITASAEYHSSISGSSNTGCIKGRGSTGGIVGETNESVDDCWNSGRVGNIGGAGNAGGIAGLTSGSIGGCINIGEVCDTYSGGGIAGYNDYRSSVRECYNDGFVHTETDGARAGGIGAGNGAVSNCYNTGTVSVGGEGGTACGITHNLWQHSDSHGNYSSAKAENCYNMGRILALGSKCRAGNVASAPDAPNAGALCKNCYYLDGAVEGNDFIATDGAHTNLTPLAEEDFRTLADKVNKTRYPFDPLPFIQGYYRPVLQCSRGQMSKHYFEVTTLAGDSALIDLGMPMDNTFFTTDTAGLVLDAYNMLVDDTVRRAMLVDGKDFAPGRSFTARSLYYARRQVPIHGTACLPFDVQESDLPLGTQLMSPGRIIANATLLADTIQGARAGQPFVFCHPDGTTEWDIRKQNVKVVAETTDTPLLKGLFAKNKTWEGYCFLPEPDSTLYAMAQPSDSLVAFRAYVLSPDVESDTLVLAGDIKTGTGCVDAGCRPAISAHKGCITISGAEGKTIEVHAATGTTVYSGCASHRQVSIPVRGKGIYMVAVGKQTRKVLVK